MSRQRLLVTVGTTSFDNLIETFKLPKVQTSLNSSVSILYQIGRGNVELPDAIEVDETVDDVWDKIEKSDSKQGWIRLSSNMPKLMKSSTHLICHGGAGSILEGLQCKLPILAISNPILMSNHQEELCNALYQRGEIISLSGQDLDDTKLSENLIKLINFVPPNSALTFLDEIISSFENTMIELTNGDRNLFTTNLQH